MFGMGGRLRNSDGRFARGLNGQHDAGTDEAVNNPDCPVRSWPQKPEVKRWVKPNPWLEVDFGVMDPWRYVGMSDIELVPVEIWWTRSDCAPPTKSNPSLLVTRHVNAGDDYTQLNVNLRTLVDYLYQQGLTLAEKASFVRDSLFYQVRYQLCLSEDVDQLFSVENFVQDFQAFVNSPDSICSAERRELHGDGVEVREPYEDDARWATWDVLEGGGLRGARPILCCQLEVHDLNAPVSLPHSPALPASRIPHPSAQSSLAVPSRPMTAKSSVEPSYDLNMPDGNWTRTVTVPVTWARDKSARLVITPAWALSNPSYQCRRHFDPQKSSDDARARKCLGIWVCEAQGCQGSGRPLVRRPAAKSKVLKAGVSEDGDLEERPDGDEAPATAAPTESRRNVPARDICLECAGPLVQKQCSATLVLVKPAPGATETEIWHEGWHTHPPPAVRSVPHSAKNRLLAIASVHPHMTPAQLRAGRHTGEPSPPAHIPSALDIHPKFSNLRSISTVRREGGLPPTHTPSSPILTPLLMRNCFPELASLLLAPSQPCARASGISTLHICSTFMRRRLLAGDDEVELRAVLRRGGMPSDGHYTYFSGGFTLITTTIFDIRLARWIPVVQTVTTSEKTEAYRRHFAYIIKVFVDGGLDMLETLVRLLSVVNYSAAQAAGYDAAFADWFSDLDFDDTDTFASHLESIFTDVSLADNVAAAISEKPAYSSIDESTASLVRACRAHLATATSADRYEFGLKLAACSRCGCQRHFDASVFRTAKSKRIPTADAAAFTSLALG